MATDPTLPEWVRVARAIPPSRPSAAFDTAVPRFASDNTATVVQAARQNLPPGAVARATIGGSTGTELRPAGENLLRGYRAPREVTAMDGSVATPPMAAEGPDPLTPVLATARLSQTRDPTPETAAPGVKAFNPGRYGDDLRSQVFEGPRGAHGERVFSNNPYAREFMPGPRNTNDFDDFSARRAAYAGRLSDLTDTERAMLAAREQAARLAPQNFGDLLKSGANTRAERADVREAAMAEIEREKAAQDAAKENPWVERRTAEFMRLNAMTPAQRISELGPSAANPQTAADIAMANAMLDARVNPDTLPSGKAGLSAIAGNLAGEINAFDPLRTSTWWNENLATGANDLLDYSLDGNTLEGPVGPKGGRRRRGFSDEELRRAFGGRDPRQTMEALRIARGNNPDYVPQRIADRKYVQD